MSFTCQVCFLVCRLLAARNMPGLHLVKTLLHITNRFSVCEQMERRARLRKIMATMDDEDERKAALPGTSYVNSQSSFMYSSRCRHKHLAACLLCGCRLHFSLETWCIVMTGMAMSTHALAHFYLLSTRKVACKCTAGSAKWTHAVRDVCTTDQPGLQAVLLRRSTKRRRRKKRSFSTRKARHR